MSNINSRDIVLNILMDIENNKTFSNIAIGKALRQVQFENKQDRAFITRLAEGVVEYKIRLDYCINQFSKTKINKCKPLIRSLLRMGAYQILFMDSVPDSAACNECVALAKKHGFVSLAGFVNGVLRNLARKKDDIEYPSVTKEPIKAMSIKYSTSEWLVEKLINDYKDDASKILEASFKDRPTSIRVNTTKISKSELKKLISNQGIKVEDGLYSDKALLISDYDFIKKVPGYKQGYFTVQDESSICAVTASHVKEGDTVLDLCAAPGGKTTAACEYLNNTGRVFSMDISVDKLSLIEENVERLGFTNVDISAHDATEPLDMVADVVISDVPCSGLGIIGRKNDIKYNLTKEGIDELISIQRRIMEAAANYVKTGGCLLYSTCTINPNENTDNVKWFLDKHKDFKLETERLFVQGVDNCDGFYYAIIRR